MGQGRPEAFLTWFKAEYHRVTGDPYIGAPQGGYDLSDARHLTEHITENEALKQVTTWFLRYVPLRPDPLFECDPTIGTLAKHANWCLRKMRSHTPENPTHKPWTGYGDEKAPTVEQVKARRGAQSFAKEMIEALEGYKEARAGGVSHEDAKKGLELVLREAWPRQDRQWRYDCDVCRDTGLMPYTKPEGIYGGEPHRRVEPCQCKHGLPMRMGWQTKAERLAAKAGD